MPSSGEFEKI